MKWLDNVRVTTKIICLIVIAGLFLASVGLTGAYRLKSAQNDVDRLYGEKMQATRLLNECSLTVRAIQSRILENNNLTDAKQIAKNKKDIGDYVTHYEDTWKEYKQVSPNDDGADEAEQHWKDFKGSADKMMDLALAGQQEEARKVYNTTGIKEIIAWDNTMRPLREAKDAEAMAIKDKNSADASSAITSMIVQTSVALLIMCLFGWMLAKAIVTPLQQMVGPGHGIRSRFPLLKEPRGSLLRGFEERVDFEQLFKAHHFQLLAGDLPRVQTQPEFAVDLAVNLGHGIVHNLPLLGIEGLDHAVL